MTKIERKNGLPFSIKGGKDVDIYNAFHAALISCTSLKYAVAWASPIFHKLSVVQLRVAVMQFSGHCTYF